MVRWFVRDVVDILCDYVSIVTHLWLCPSSYSFVIVSQQLFICGYFHIFIRFDLLETSRSTEPPRELSLFVRTFIHLRKRERTFSICSYIYSPTKERKRSCVWKAVLCLDTVLCLDNI
jgi:hypothetical protein